MNPPPIRTLRQLYGAITYGRNEEVLAALTHEPSWVNGKLPKGHTPLTLTLSQRNWTLAAALLERGADPDRRLYSHHSCLTWACLYQQEKLAEKILACTKALNKADSGGYVPIYWAVWLRKLPLVEDLLARGARVDIKLGHPPLNLAAQFGDLEICRRLVSAGAPLDAYDYRGNTALHAAVTGASPAVISFLLKRRPELINATDSDQRTALHLAALTLPGDSAIIELLLAAGANLEARDKNGSTPAILAAAHNTAKSFNFLLSKGAKFSQADREKAMKLAIEHQSKDAISMLMARFDLARPLDAKHPLRLAIARKSWTLVDAFLAGGIDPDARTIEGEALLPWSQAQFLPELAQLLLKHGAVTGRERATDWVDQVMLMRKLGKVELEPGEPDESEPIPGHLLVALQKNLESLGFTLTPELADRVLSLDMARLEEFYQLLLPCLRALVGADVEYKPMYPNFPHQVKEAPLSELHLNAVLHYLGDAIGRRIMPYYEKLVRQPFTEQTPLKPIGLAAPGEASRLFQRLLEARGSLSPQDKEFITWTVMSRGASMSHLLPQDVPLRENAALLAAALMRVDALRERAANYLKNGTDVLRLAAALFDGDVSLAANTRFGKLPKSWRRMMLAVLEADPQLEESLAREPEKFKRLGERLHPGEYRARYPKTWEAFRQLRSGAKFATFASIVEQHLAKEEVETCLPLLQRRPGEFARRLDHLLRLGPPEPIVAAFQKVAPAVASPLLLLLRQHFRGRDTVEGLRVFFPKGDLAKLMAVPNTLPALPSELCTRVAEICQETLLGLYAKRPPLGPCWVDERLRSYTVPFALRSASKTLRTVARGSRIPFASSATARSEETLRFFIWWRDGKSRTDIDLSALVIDEDFNYLTALAYYNLKELGGYHSGDITSAPNGASEFIDIEIETLGSRGARYVMMVVNSYTTQPYCELPECFAGFMQRADPNSGEIYEPRSVQNRFDLSANTTIAIPLICDLKRREVIWTDLSLKQNLSHVNNVHGNRSRLGLLCEAMVKLKKPNLYDLFTLHVAARGSQADSPEGAMTVFSSEPGAAVTPYDIPLILADYL